VNLPIFTNMVMQFEAEDRHLFYQQFHTQYRQTCV